MKISLMKNLIYLSWELKENVMEFDELIKKRLKYNRMQTNMIPQWNQGDIGIPTTWCVKITISEFASFLNFLYPRISKVTLYIYIFNI